MAIYQLLLPNRILYGSGSFQKIGEQTRSLGKKAFIISDPIMNQMGNVMVCEKLLHDSYIPYATYLGIDSEPTDIHVQEALAICKKEQCDVIVALGGGSCLDTAKAVAVLMTNGGHIRDYVKNPIYQLPLPLIAIPTTAGTGSEVTKVMVIIDTKNDVKMMLSHPELIPKISIIDSTLTFSCPPHVTAATGIDALCHAIEAFISLRAQPVTDILSLQAIKLIMTYLRQAYQQGDHPEAREQMALASMLAGTAFSNSSVTLIHGMSRPIGAMFHVPHGVSNAMLLASVLEYTQEHTIERLASIGRSISPKKHELFDDDQIVDSFIQDIKKLCKDLQIPNMKTWGIEKHKLDQVVSKMAHDALASGSPQNNPKIPSHEEIINLYYTSYNYDFMI